MYIEVEWENDHCEIGYRSIEVFVNNQHEISRSKVIWNGLSHLTGIELINNKGL